MFAVICTSRNIADETAGLVCKAVAFFSSIYILIFLKLQHTTPVLYADHGPAWSLHLFFSLHVLVKNKWKEYLPVYDGVSVLVVKRVGLCVCFDRVTLCF